MSIFVPSLFTPFSSPVKFASNQRCTTNLTKWKITASSSSTAPGVDLSTLETAISKVVNLSNNDITADDHNVQHAAMNLRLPAPSSLNDRSSLGKRSSTLGPQCGLSKKGHRFLISITTISSTHDPSTTHRLLRKFVSSSSKHVALNTLSHLLSPSLSHPYLSSLAFPLYTVISEAVWFDWNAKLVAQVIAALYKQERYEEAETFLSKTVSRLSYSGRDLCNFYCHCIDFSSKHNSTKGVLDSCKQLKNFLSSSSSIYVQKRAYESMINGLCVIGLVPEAENLMGEMKDMGLKASVSEFRSIVHAYGKLGLFEDMKRCADNTENEGFALDTVCCNMVLSSLGARNQLLEMVSWLQRMKNLSISCSIRSYNSVLNSCPTVMLMLQDPKSIPLSIQELLDNLGGDEAKLVQELVVSSVMEEAMKLGSSELKLDLHGMHLGSAYLIWLQWLNEMKLRFSAKDCMVPTQVTVVCGMGKHSNIRGESPVRSLIREMIERMNCPLRIDRKNVGCFITKGKVFDAWLCRHVQ